MLFAPSDMNIRALQEEEYEKLYNKAFEKVDIPTDEIKEALRVRISSLQQAVVERLGEKWKEGKDFEVAWDLNYWFHVCGSICAKRVACADYVHRIIDALNTDRSPECWTYHTAIELWRLRWEFFIRNGDIFYPDDGPDFSRLLTRSSSFWW
jgi:hypothetical protein